jgi:hypothetical protein
MNKMTGLKVVLAMICIYHVVLGLATFVSGDLTVKLAKSIFGLNLEMTPQMSYIVQLLGVYAIAFGLVAGLAAADPLKHPVLLNVIVVLYALRILNKLISMNQFQQAFGASMAKVWTDVVLLAAFGIAVVALRPGRSLSAA